MAWFILLPVFWRLDLSKAQASYYDVFSMAPLALFHLVIFFILAMFDLYLRKPSLLILLLISFYFPVIQLTNYPYLTYRDVYLHSAPVKTILEDGQLNYTRDVSPQSWPGSFDLHAISSIVLGLNLIDANYLLYIAITVLLALISYSFAKKMENKGYKLAAYSPILFQCLFANYLFDFNHYSRATLEFILLFLFFFSFMFCKGRRGLLLQLLFAVAVIIVHPFASLALAVFAVSFFVLSSVRTRPKQICLVLFSVVSFVGWFSFVGFQKFDEAVGRLRTFFSPQYVAPLSTSLVTSGNLPWWDSVLRGYFKYSLIALVAVASLVVVYVVYTRFHEEGRDDTPVGLSSLVVMSLIVTGGLLLLPDWGLTRGSAFLAFPAAFTSVFLVDRMARNRKPGRFRRLNLPNKKILFALFLAFVVTLSAAVMVLRFESNYYFGGMTHTEELSSLSFFFSHDENSPVAILSWQTSVYSAYYNYRGSHSTLRLWYIDLDNLAGNSSRLLQSESGLINQSQAVIRGMRDQFNFGGFDSPANILEIIDGKMILPKFDQVYSCGEYTIFERPSRNI